MLTCDIEKKMKKKAAHFITRAAKGLARVITVFSILNGGRM